MNHFRFVAALAILAAPHLPVVASPVAAQTLSASESEAIALAERRGALLYAYDQAAWHGTDDLMERLPDWQSKVAGFIVDGPVESPRLYFFDRSQVPQAVYVAQFDGRQLVSGSVLGESDDRSLPPSVLRLIAARNAVAKAGVKVRGCSRRPFNTVVLPPEREGSPIAVYLLTPQTQIGQIPFGGHYRIEVSESGAVAEPQAFANSCLTLSKSGEPGGPTPAALFATHVVTPTPTELHVFSQYYIGLPLYVGTSGDRIWKVENGAITLSKLPGK